jgi:Bacteriophage holin family
MKHFLNDLIHIMGFHGLADLKQSFLNLPMLMYAGNLLVLFTVISYYTDAVLGLNFALYIAFLTAIVVEIVTGLWASKKDGKEIEGNIFGRSVTKIALYSIFLFALNMFARYNSVTLVGVEFNIWGWMYWLFFSGINIQLLISILNNMARMGFKETKMIAKLLNKKLQEHINTEDKNDTE